MSVLCLPGNLLALASNERRALGRMHGPMSVLCLPGNLLALAAQLERVLSYLAARQVGGHDEDGILALDRLTLRSKISGADPAGSEIFAGSGSGKNHPVSEMNLK
jgi:hypothetical protein